MADTTSQQHEYALRTVAALKKRQQLSGKVRAKFRVAGKKRAFGYNQTAGEIEVEIIDMAAVKHDTFGDATPSGSIAMTIANADAYHAMPLGAEFYVDFTPVPVEETQGYDSVKAYL